ncbi:MAG: Gfo/Idh/MocA family oxidoreductase [Candidatus Latescibacteria bacterium]|nr:Gfo/Idh/MocA family oxidoreductase [Candidatus Latescibacterota bacterium]
MLDDTYAHSPLNKMFDQSDVYGVGYDDERASRKRIRLGLIGAGGVAQSKHIPAIMRLKTIWEPVDLAAISSLDERTGRRLEQTYGCRWYGDSAAMLSQETLDGVLVTSPDGLHAEHGIACLEAGLPVMVEKPLCRSLRDSQRLCRLADERGLVLMTVSNKRYSPPYRRAKRFVDEGPVANPAMFCGKFNLGYDDVDLFESGTVHLFDLTRFFMGNVRSVHAVGVNHYQRNRTGYPIDNAIITFEFTSSAIGTLYTTSTALSLKPWERVEIYGNNGWLAVEDQFELILYDSEEGPAKSWRPVIPNTLIFDEEFGGYMGEIENFLQAIRGAERPLVTGWDGHHALELCLASHRSIQRRETVDLPLDEG